MLVGFGIEVRICGSFSRFGGAVGGVVLCLVFRGILFLVVLILVCGFILFFFSDFGRIFKAES